MRDPRAYLVRIVTRQALNRLRTLARRREDYVGEWLPEPLLTSPDVADDVELAESVSIAMLTVLETLGPTERAVFVLREVFDMPYDEIAEAVGQDAGRGAADRPPRARARGGTATADAGELGRAAGGRGAVPGRAQTPATSRACSTCSPPTWCWSPTAAVVRRRGPPSDRGRRPGGRLLSRFARLAPARRQAPVWLNGAPAVRIDLDGELDTAVSLVIEDGRITRIYAIRNPEKLGRLGEEMRLSRTH